MEKYLNAILKSNDIDQLTDLKMCLYENFEESSLLDNSDSGSMKSSRI